jgi:hypothetical protein
MPVERYLPLLGGVCFPCFFLFRIILYFNITNLFFPARPPLVFFRLFRPAGHDAYDV